MSWRNSPTFQNLINKHEKSLKYITYIHRGKIHRLDPQSKSSTYYEILDCSLLSLTGDPLGDLYYYSKLKLTHILVLNIENLKSFKILCTQCAQDLKQYIFLINVNLQAWGSSIQQRMHQRKLCSQFEKNAYLDPKVFCFKKSLEVVSQK